VKSGEDFEAAEPPWFLTLHWAWLLVAEAVAYALRARYSWERLPSLDVLLFWSFLQAGWLSRVDQRSNTIYWYLGDFILGCATASRVVERGIPTVAVLLRLTVAVIAIVSLFHFRREMKRYFEDTDDIDLDLSPWMTFQFSTLYFQYKFRKISKLRKTSRVSSIAR
jgi:hypothetical protein